MSLQKHLLVTWFWHWFKGVKICWWWMFLWLEIFSLDWSCDKVVSSYLKRSGQISSVLLQLLVRFWLMIIACLTQQSLLTHQDEMWFIFQTGHDETVTTFENIIKYLEEFVWNSFQVSSVHRMQTTNRTLHCIAILFTNLYYRCNTTLKLYMGLFTES